MISKFPGFILLFFISLIHIISNCQTTSYNQFSGQSNKKDYQIYLNINAAKLSGNMYHKFRDSLTDFVRVEFVGNIINDSNFILREFVEENNFATGILNGRNFKAVLQFSDSSFDTISLPMSYEPGEIRFESISTASSVKLFPTDASPEATFEMTVLVPGSGSAVMLRDEVMKFLNIYPDSINDQLIEPGKQILIEQNTFLNHYLSLKSLYDTTGPSFNWFKTASTQILFNSPQLFCIENAMYAFTGGAHGIENISYGIFSTLTNRQLTSIDLFKPNTQFILSNLITNSVRKSNDIHPDSSLPDYLYFVKQIEPNENIYITPSGIGFYYNSYEIAPYSTGQTNVFFRFVELKGLLTKEFENLITGTKKE
jgi:hypothetical protein